MKEILCVEKWSVEFKKINRYQLKWLAELHIWVLETTRNNYEWVYKALPHHVILVIWLYTLPRKQKNAFNQLEWFYVLVSYNFNTRIVIKNMIILHVHNIEPGE